MSTPQCDVVVIGGGLVGLACAHYLARDGARVVLLERDELGSGSSYGNTGVLMPTHCAPMATVPTVLQGVRWLFDSSAPLVIRPWRDAALAPWLGRFIFAARPSRVAEVREHIRALNIASVRLHADLADVEDNDSGMTAGGWLSLYRSGEALVAARIDAGRVRQEGGACQELDEAATKELEPSIRVKLAGAMWYPDGIRLDPYRLVAFLGRLVRREGVEVRTGAGDVALDVAADRVVAARTRLGPIHAESFVLAAGAWSARVLRELGMVLPMQPAKGYSLTFRPAPVTLQHPLELADHHVIVRPMTGAIRATGGFDLVGFDESACVGRLAQIRHAVQEYLGDWAAREAAVSWFGFRPMTPDSLPVIGPTLRYPNLILATGHGQRGVMHAPVTGKLIAEMLRGVPPSLDSRPYSPIRFGL